MPVVCASCGSETETVDPCQECGDPARLDGRFRLEERLGRGSAGITYRATRLDDDHTVCIKELAYSAMNSFEMKELFEREATVLRQLDHPGIPNYLDYFSVEADKNLSLYLVQEFVEGPSLEAEMDRRRYTELEILEILEELADILIYLQQLRPPVFHRDIKPSNVMRREASERLVLVDFGSVKATTDGAVGGSTIAGTFGYMAPEQHWGKAEPATDVYGLGALGLALLSRREPKTFVGSNHRLEWEDEVEASPPIRSLFADLLAHDIEERTEDAEAAAARIREARERLESESAAERAERSEPDPRPAPEDDGAREAPGGDLDPAFGSPRTIAGAREVQEREQREARQTSTAADPSDRDAGTGRALIFALILGFLGILLLVWATDGSTRRAPKATAGVQIGAESCTDNACDSLETSALGAFEFGAPPEEHHGRGIALENGSPETEREYPLYRTTYRIEEAAATCRLHFAGEEDGLTKYECEFESFETGPKSTTRRLLRKFMGRFGEPTVLHEPSDDREKDEPQIEETFKGNWAWRGDAGDLELVVRHESSIFEQALEPSDNQPSEISPGELMSNGSSDSWVAVEQTLTDHPE